MRSTGIGNDRGVQLNNNHIRQCLLQRSNRRFQRGTGDAGWYGNGEIRLPRLPSSAHQILIFVADPPSLRHHCENSATQNENLHGRPIIVSYVADAH